jgi:hypothetical protein
MTTDGDKAKRLQLVRRAAVVGMALAVLCHTLPTDYRATCNAFARFFIQICGGP